MSNLSCPVPRLHTHRPLDIFKADPNYLESEEKYKSIKAEILGEDSDDEESGSEESDEEESDQEGMSVIFAVHLPMLTRIVS